MASEHRIRIGKRIQTRREEVGLTQRELADLLPGKADGGQVSKWERGRNRPSDDTLEHIAEALDTNVAYFMVDEPRPGTPDLIGTLNGSTSQLDRVEAKLDAVLELLRDSAAADAAGAADEA